MNVTLMDSLLVLVLLLNFHCLITTRLPALIAAVGWQGALLGLCYPLVHGGGHGVWITLRVLLLTAAFVVVKGWVIPRMLLQAMRDAELRWQIVGLIGLVPSLLLGAVGTALAIWFAQSMPLDAQDASHLVVPASLSTAWTGLLILTARRRAVTQVLGYLLLENGIFIFGLLLVEALPLMVELGALLDLFVGVVVMGIILHHVSRTVPTAEHASLTSLRE